MSLTTPAHLAWFAIWRREDPKQRGRREGQPPEHQDGSQDGDGDEEEEEDTTGILYRYSSSDAQPDDLSRKVGLAQGLIDFTG